MNRLADALDQGLDLLVAPGFTSFGFKARSTGWDDPAADPERLAGRVVLVTGATSGLGQETAAELAGAGADVWLVGRDEGRLEKARAQIGERTSSGTLHTGVCDLSSLASVRRFADFFLAEADGADVLINNAAVLPDSRSHTDEGFELAFATNLLGPFLLTNLLTPALMGRPDARIINVVSGGLYTAGLDVDDLQLENRSYDGARAYAHTKRALLILTELWNERLAGEGIEAHATHPGWADTPGVADSLPLFHRVVGPLLRDAHQGADTTVWLTWCQEALGQGGELWHDRRTRPKHRIWGTKAESGERQALWSKLTELASQEQESSIERNERVG